MFERGKRSWLIWNLVVAALLVALGIVTLVNFSNGDFQSVIILIVAIFIIADAGFRLLFQVVRVFHIQPDKEVKTKFGSLLAIAAEISLGVALISLSNDLKLGGKAFHELFVYIGNFFGTAFICFGGMGLLLSILYLIKRQNKKAENIIGIILSAAMIALGILILIFGRNKETFMRTFFIFFGILLLGAGCLAAGFTISIYRKLRHIQILVDGGESGEKTNPEEKPEENKEEQSEEPKKE